MAESHVRSRAAATGGSVMKLHRHSVVLDARPYTIIRLRADAHVRFSTNNFHETWHVISDEPGAKTLARLLWGLAYQRLPGTLVLIDGRHLDTNPFDAEPTDPIVLLPSHLTVLTRQAARSLRRLSWTNPDGTVRWRTHGLDTRSPNFTSGGTLRSANANIRSSPNPPAGRPSRVSADCWCWRAAHKPCGNGPCMPN